MPRAIPSQAVALIDKIFPWAAQAEQVERDPDIDYGQLENILAIVGYTNEIPEELIENDFTAYKASLSILKKALERWSTEGGMYKIAPYTPGFGKVSPIRLLRSVLAKCPDETSTKEIHQNLGIGDRFMEEQNTPSQSPAIAAQMKIFLSHKSADKPLVRDFKDSLALLGFTPWMDEDALDAGVVLERGILKGIKDSCAAVFFVTPSFCDESYLATEINYAIGEKREKGDRFAIITLVMEKEGQKGTVPELLRQYVWKEPRTDLEALREIIKAVPVRAGSVDWKSSR